MRMTVCTRRSFLPPGDEAKVLAGTKASPANLFQLTVRSLSIDNTQMALSVKG